MLRDFERLRSSPLVNKISSFRAIPIRKLIRAAVRSRRSSQTESCFVSLEITARNRVILLDSVVEQHPAKETRNGYSFSLLGNRDTDDGKLMTKMRVAYPYPSFADRCAKNQRLLSCLLSSSSRMEKPNRFSATALMPDRETPRLSKVLWSKFKRIPWKVKRSRSRDSILGMEQLVESLFKDSPCI